MEKQVEEKKENLESRDEENESKKTIAKDKRIKVSEAEYVRLQQAVEEYKDKYLRLYAEFENARKRMERDKMEFVKYANEGVLTDFLDLVDNWERCVEVAKKQHDDYGAFLKGVEMTWKQIEEFLKKNNVKVIEARGKKFDHNYHEVLMQEENEDVEEDTVLEEYQKGYTLNNKVIRTVKVKLSKNKEKKDA